MDMHQQLVVYKKEYNTTNVLTKYKDDPKPGTWVSHQRAAYKNKTFREECCQLLNAINFDWGKKTRLD